MRLDDLVRELDAYFRLDDVANDAAWGDVYDLVGAPHWRDYVEEAWAERWNGLMVRGDDKVERAATCVFPSGAIVSALEPRTLLFSEHPIAYDDDVAGFNALARETFDSMQKRGISFYHAHGPLDMHPDVSPSRLCAKALGLTDLDEYYPIADGIPGGAVVGGDSTLSVYELASRLRTFLGPEIPVSILSAPREEAGRVAVAAGGGAQPPILTAAVERGCQTFVTGNAATRCRLDFVQREVGEFRARADDARVAVIDGTHYGTETPPQLAMADWFRARAVPARFMPSRPERVV